MRKPLGSKKTCLNARTNALKSAGKALQCLMLLALAASCASLTQQRALEEERSLQAEGAHRLEEGGRYFAEQMRQTEPVTIREGEESRATPSSSKDERSSEPAGVRLQHGKAYDVRSGSSVQYALAPEQLIPWGESIEQLEGRLALDNGRGGYQRIEQKPFCSSVPELSGVRSCDPNFGTTLGIWSGDFGDTQWLFEPTLYYHEGRFYRFTLSFNSDAFPFLRNAFERALGSPRKASSERIQNRMGAGFERETLVWETKNSIVTAVSRGPSRVDRGTAVVTYRPIGDLVKQKEPGAVPF